MLGSRRVESRASGFACRRWIGATPCDVQR
jgi:hypothetical protein